jgi:O-antigen ligase
MTRFVEWRAQAGVAWPLGVATGAALALWVVTEPWILPRLVGGLFFRWHVVAAIAAFVTALVVLNGIRGLKRVPFDQWLLCMVVGALQTLALGAGPINLLNVGIVLLVLWWMLDLAHTAEEPRDTPLLAHLLVLLAALAMISVLGEQQSPRGLTALMPKLLMAWILLRMLHTESSLRLALRALVVTSVLSAMLGVAQSAAFFLYGLELHRMDDDSPRFIMALGVHMLRVPGLLQNPQAYCHALAVGFVLLTYAWFVGHGRRSRWNPLIWGGVLILGAAIVLSFSRGAWAAVAAGLILLPVMVWPRHAIHWFLVLGLLTLAGLWTGALNHLLSTYRSFTLSNTEIRVELLAAGLQVLAEHPWRGVGLMNFEFYSPTLERLPVHNSLLQVATEMGVPGLLAFVAILASPIVHALKALRHAHGEPAHRLRAMLLAYFVYMIAIQGEPTAYSPILFFYVVLLDATARVAIRTQPPPAANSGAAT